MMQDWADYLDELRGSKNKPPHQPASRREGDKRK